MNQNKEYTGTPERVGAELASDALGPTLSNLDKSVTDEQACRMMAGMIAFLAGAVAQTFGTTVATGMLRGIEDNISSNAEQLQKVQ